MFPFLKYHPESAVILRNFCEKFTADFAHHNKKEKKHEYYEWMVFNASMHNVTVSFPKRAKDTHSIPSREARFPTTLDFDHQGWRTENRLGFPPPPPTAPAVRRKASPDPLRFGTQPVTAYKTHRRIKVEPSYMDRPLSPHSGTPVNPKSMEFFGQRIPKPRPEMPHPTRQSVRGPADECFVAPWSQLDYKQPPIPGLRPRTTMAEYRPCFGEQERALRAELKTRGAEQLAALENESDLEEGERAVRESEVRERAKTPTLAYNTVPRRTLISRIGTNDRDGYRHFPPAEYSMASSTGPACTPLLF